MYFPHKRGPIVTSTLESSHSPPPQSSLPPTQGHYHVPSLPSHYYNHPSTTPLMHPRAHGHPQYPHPSSPRSPGSADSPSPSAIYNPLNSMRTSGAPLPSQSGPRQDSPVTAHAAEASTNGSSLKRARSPTSAEERGPRQEQHGLPYAYPALQPAASAA